MDSDFVDSSVSTELSHSDSELSEVRDVCDLLAEVIVDGWIERYYQVNSSKHE